MVAPPFYLPEGTDVSVLGYWYPPDGGGAIGSDQMAVLRSAKNPVLAHHFLNFMLDEKNAYENFTGFVGYQPPQISLDPERLIADGVVPENLSAAIVRESDFDKGYPELELSPEAAVLWQNAWAEFKAGV
jgi:spermidine/putrescine transport system substrate-binding protein